MADADAADAAVARARRVFMYAPRYSVFVHEC